MTNKALLEEITKNASILDSHLKRLKDKPDQLHEIDIDLLSEKLRDMYSLILELDAGHQVQEEKIPEKKEEEIITKEKESVITEARPDEPPAPTNQPPEAESEPEPDPEPIQPKAYSHQPSEPEPDPVPRPPSFEPEPLQPSAPSHQQPEPEIESEPIPEPDPAPRTSHPEPDPDPAPRTSHPEPEPDPAPRTAHPEPDPEPKTTADLFSETTTIADSFQVEKDNSIAATVNPQPVQDLKMAIGINDKFLFINELFEGDPAVYNQAIESLNVAGGPEQAVHAMEGYREQYNWADNSEAYHRLNKIVKSKYNS